MKFEIDLKTLITLGGILAMLAGSFYTTKLRLENIEAQIVKIEEKQDRLDRRVNRKSGKKGKEQKK
tara:strand:+ start:1999 stop:2196 length:198 start_codon:yes stop_codon:yes gene_type:complete